MLAAVASHQPRTITHILEHPELTYDNLMTGNFYSHMSTHTTESTQISQRQLITKLIERVLW